MTKIHYRSCNLCEAMCGLEIKHDGQEIVSIRGDNQDPFSKGFICPKAVALQDIYNDPDRLKRPLKKTADGWQEISWRAAFDEVAHQLKRIQAQYGNDAVGIYQGNPSVHNMGTMLFSPMFARSLRTRNKFSATSADQLPHHFVSQSMLGHLLLLPVPDINRTDYFLVFGANPMASNGSIMTAAGMPNRLKALRERGGKLVVVDPRKTETAAQADSHFYIRPGEDVYVLAGMVHLILTRQTNHLPSYFKNLDLVREVFAPFTPEIVERITEFPKEDLETMVNDFCNAESAVCYGRMGVSTQANGTLCQYMIYLINMLTGNFDRPGGFMLPTPAVDVVKASGTKGTLHKHDRWRSRVRKMPEFGGELPVAVLAEEILTPGEGQIRAMVTSAGNPVLSTPNGRQLDKAFESLDFMVSIDIYVTETSRHADIILPPATGLETPHYDLVFNNLAVSNTAKYSDRLFPVEKGAMEDWQIFKQLAGRMKKQGLMGKIRTTLMTPSRMLNYGLKRGPYKGLDLNKLKKNPHGIDLGPLQSCMPDRLFTSDQKVDLAPENLIVGVRQLPHRRADTSSMTLIGRRHLRSNNSWMHNSMRLVKGPERCTLLINHQDAEERSIRDGTEVTVRSRVGEIKIKAEVTEDIKRGVVSIPHGWGHSREKTKWKIAEAHAGASLNDLTDDLLVDPVSGNAAFNGVPVEVVTA